MRNSHNVYGSGMLNSLENVACGTPNSIENTARDAKFSRLRDAKYPRIYGSRDTKKSRDAKFLSEYGSGMPNSPGMPKSL